MQKSDDALLKAIEEDAFAESERLVKEAEDAALAIIGEAQAEVSSERKRRVDAVCRGFEKRRVFAVNNARVRVNALQLKARRDVLDEVFKGIPAFFEKMPDGDYSRLIKDFYDELYAAWKEGFTEEPVVLAGGREARLLEKAGVAAKEAPSVFLGVALESKDGRVRFENTVYSRIEKARDGLSVELNRIIFT